MNGSQTRTKFGLVLALIGVALTAATPVLDQLPQLTEWKGVVWILFGVGLLKTVVGALLAAYNDKMGIPADQKRRARAARGALALLLIAGLLGGTLSLSGCNENDFQRAQKLANRASIAVAGAPILIDSFVEAKLISEALGEELVKGFDSFGSYLAQANDLLQKVKALDGNTKGSVLDKLRLASEALDTFQTSGLALIQSAQIKERVARIITLARTMLAGVIAYMNASKVMAIFLRPYTDREVARLEELMKPLPQLAAA